MVRVISTAGLSSSTRFNSPELTGWFGAGLDGNNEREREEKERARNRAKWSKQISRRRKEINARIRAKRPGMAGTRAVKKGGGK